MELTMEPITLIIVLAVAIVVTGLAAALGYLLAKGKGTKVQTELDASLTQVNAQLEQLRSELADSEAEAKSLNDQLKSTEQMNTKCSTLTLNHRLFRKSSAHKL